MNKGAESEEAKSTPDHRQTESKKRKKVNHACVYCRRSHMTCDAGRPCSRCVKRNIGHLCYDEARPTKAKRAGSSSPTSSAVKSPEPVSTAMTIPAPVQVPPVQTLPPKTVRMSSSELMKPPTAPAHYVPTPDLQASSVYATQSILPANLDKSFTTDFSMLYDPSLFGVGIQNQPPYAQFASEQATSEFLVLSDFLNIMGSPQQRVASPPVPVPNLVLDNATGCDDPDSGAASRRQSRANSVTAPNSQNPSKPGSINGISESAQEKFFLTAADPNPESAEDRLKSVINAKVEAGLMKPFNYVRGYARLQKYMDANMSAESKQRILAPLSTFRPAFRAIAKRLTDVDLILVEEAFERLLLDYDRVFTSISVPACLWRRTGEIFRGNKEFAALLNIPAEHLRDGKLAITELMAEDSAVNYWEKYGNIAFDGAQKAVLTSCLLQLQRGDGVVSCCFSFTIKRDRYNIPSCIVGNFIPVKLS